MKVNIGELNKRIAIVELIEGQDDEGFPLDEPIPVEIYKVWAKVTNKSGSEIFKSNSDYSKKITRFLIRYRKRINESQKVRYNNILYDIQYLNNYNEENKWLEIIAEVVK
ncbi:phage head closure protein [Clostridium sp. D2Q-11]|uniref:Phage head closure protein n=1 Tax=Anaeromonas frigoriresistens TaxID=2683708 RepID=A0A942V4P8_9FIRM|nr:phage head closure protein [Anaeromonas frigoriresistens]MBS4539822.1 phage head closure protein [Anaeromonas frigoriresistens]